jgi:hypothetical protein
MRRKKPAVSAEMGTAGFLRDGIRLREAEIQGEWE